MADSSDIDNALVTLLSSDATLRGLLPGNVWIDEAPTNVSRFAVVALADHEDGRSFGARAWESALYLVKAVVLAPAQEFTAGPTIKAAAARIDELLEGAMLTVPGYVPMTCYREQRIRFAEIDDLDATVRWLHRGGHYRVVMSTTP